MELGSESGIWGITQDSESLVVRLLKYGKEVDSWEADRRYTFEELHGDKPDAVVLIMTNADGTKILLNKEFRMAAGMWVVNFPAGLIDPGEDAKTAAARELREETGLELISVDDIIGLSYSAVGFSNEMNVCVVGKCEGEIKQSDSSFEEIEAAWYTKEDVRELLKNERFAARTQAYCYMWSHS